MADLAQPELRRVVVCYLKTVSATAAVQRRPTLDPFWQRRPPPNQ